LPTRWRHGLGVAGQGRHLSGTCAHGSGIRIWRWENEVASVCSRTAGVMTALMRNGRDRRSGKPVMGHAIVERVLLFGTRSADYIRASGHSGCIATEVILQATTGRIMTAPERFAEKSDSLLHRGRRPYMTHSVISPPSTAASRKVNSTTLLAWPSNEARVPLRS
jgi:hypothetical protein